MDTILTSAAGASSTWEEICRLLKARLAHPPVLMANYIYSSRIVKRHDLIPVGEEYEALEKALAKEAS